MPLLWQANRIRKGIKMTVKLGNRSYLLRSIKANNDGWFTRANKRFFNDVAYMAYYSGEGERFLVRSTYAWTDMFGAKPRLHYRVNPIGDNFQIQPLIDTEFNSLDDVKMWLRLH
jgi:hypothetical protein